jgi:hypothetical protein
MVVAVVTAVRGAKRHVDAALGGWARGTCVLPLTFDWHLK